MGTKKVERRLIVVKSTGVLPELNFITGPILHPWYVDVPTIQQMVINGKDVYEVNPEDHSDRTKLTIKNMKTSNYIKQAIATATTKVEKKMESKNTPNVTMEPSKEPAQKNEAKQEQVSNKKTVDGDFSKK